MMSFLGKARKEDLMRLVSELDLVIPENATIAKLKQIIVDQDNFDEEFTKNLVDTIITERIEKFEREKLLLQQEKEQKEREFELEKLRLEQNPSKSRESSTTEFSIVQNKSKELAKIIQSFDSSNPNNDISTFLELFERQATRINIDKKDFVTHLLGLLPLDIAQVVTRVQAGLENDYEHIKSVLLNRFKLTPEQFRQKFLSHKKESNSTWRDFAFELNHYFEEWIEGLKVFEYRDLKELIVADQLKRRTPQEIRTHYLDEWHKLRNPEKIVEKLEEYENARYNITKADGNSEVRQNKFKKYAPIEASQKSKQPTFRAYPNNENVKNECYNNKMKCYACGFYGHKSYECKFKHKNEKKFHDNKVVDNFLLNKSQAKIEKTIYINNISVISVIDTGSEITLISEKCYHDLGSPTLNYSKMFIKGIGNESVKCKGYFIADVNIDGHILRTNIFVLENLQYSAIVGMDILSCLKFNFSKGEIEFNNVNVIEVVKNDEKSAYTREIISPFVICNSDPRISKLETAEPKYVPSDLSNSMHVDSKFNYLTLISDITDSSKENIIDISHIPNGELREKLMHMINDYNPDKVKSTDVKMKIILTDEIPVCQRARRLPITEQAIVEKQIQEWLEQGIIKPSCSDFASPIVLCKKKDGSARLCVDFRKLNKKIVKDRFPLPLIEDVIDKLEDSRVFTTLDLKNGFFHVDIEKDSTKYTSFVTHEGQYEFLKAPFGLCTSPSVFERYIFHVFKDLLRDKIVIIYVDDVIIPSKNEEEGLQKLKLVLETAAKYGLNLNFKKCQFLKRKIEFLGYIIENGTIKPSPSKTSAVQNFPTPKNIKQVQSYLGLTGYFRKFVKDYSKIAKPLSDLLRENAEFHFGPEQKKAFEELKKILTSDPVLHIFKQGSKLELHTDASSFGFGSVLLQLGDDGKMHPIHYMSKKTNPQQEKYTSYELEILAVIESLRKFRNYLLGTKFEIYTDCAAFQQTMSKKDLTPKIARWALLMEEFDYEIKHRPASQMKHADALSRNVSVAVTQVSNVDEEVTCKIANSQNNDEHIKVIKELIEKGKEENYFIKNGILYRYEAGRELLVVPEIMHSEIIKAIHKKGHFASAKTEEILKRDFFIPGVRKKIENIIGNCVKCILCNKKNGKKEGFLNPIPKEDVPLSTYHADFIGPLPSTNKNYQHIFTVVDAFTKFTWLYPVKTVSAEEALDKLRLQQKTFGNPTRIITDRGPAFTSKAFNDYCTEEGIAHSLIATGVPRGNGQVERIHRTIIPVLTKLTIDDATKWFKHVDKLQRILNSTITRSTKITPFQLLTGVPMKNKEDLMIKDILEEEYKRCFMENREELRKEAKQQILKIQEENKRQYDKKCKAAHKYSIGDLVAIQRTQFGTGLKLKVKYFGPYKITKIKGNDRYEVEKVGSHEGPTRTTTAADLMKKWTVD